MGAGFRADDAPRQDGRDGGVLRDGMGGSLAREDFMDTGRSHWVAQNQLSSAISDYHIHHLEYLQAIGQ